MSTGKLFKLETEHIVKSFVLNQIVYLLSLNFVFEMCVYLQKLCVFRFLSHRG